MGVGNLPLPQGGGWGEGEIHAIQIPVKRVACYL